MAVRRRAIEHRFEQVLGRPTGRACRGRRSAGRGRTRLGRVSGIIALGDIATGLVAIGGVAIGLFIVGGMAVRLVALGGVASGWWLMAP
jgi:hypothetical protein